MEKNSAKVIWFLGYFMIFLGIGMICGRYVEICDKIPLIFKILLIFIITYILVRFSYPDRKKLLKK